MVDDSILKILTEASAREGLDPMLLTELARAESNFNPRAVSPAGAQGLLQIIPSTQKMLGVTDPFDPVQNANAGARYLKQNLDMFGGDVPKALAAYNAGPGAVQKYNGVPPYAETQNYVQKIMSRLGSSTQEPATENAILQQLRGASQEAAPSVDPSLFVNQSHKPISKTKSVLLNILGGLTTGLGTVLALGDNPAGATFLNTGLGIFDKIGQAKQRDAEIKRQNEFLMNPNIPESIRATAGLSSISPEAAKVYADSTKPRDINKTLDTVRKVQEIQQNTPEALAAKSQNELTQLSQQLDIKDQKEREKIDRGISQLAELAAKDPAQLTEKEKFDKNYLMSKYGKSTGIKVLPSNQALSLGDAKTVFDGLAELRQAISAAQTKYGPVKGRLGAANPYNTDAQVLQALTNLNKQFTGKYLEGGVLRKEDEEKYKEILATLKDKPEVALSKVDSLQKFLDRKYSNSVSAFENAGFSVDKFPKSLLNEQPTAQTGAATGADINALRQKYKY